ncbi:hypothetical protein [Sphingomonas azotifigens]|uniref:hypothetical protein n=1 Tax=Sphingomonas azotifigens TaxID=330920 RepID=UPI00111C5F69|nr:hypothetical protein [Sphingomonas azotifigens]
MAKMGTVWDRTAAFVGERAGVLLPLAIVVFLVPGAIGTCLQLVAATSSVPIRWGLGALVLLLSLPTIWGSLAVIGLATGESGIAAAGGLATRRLLATVIVSVALGVAAIALALPVPIILALRGYDVAALSAGRAGNVVVDPQTSAMVALYMLALIPVLLFAFTRLLLVSPVVLREAVLFGAIRRSWVLTRRHGWRIFGTLLLFGVIGGVAQLAAQTVFGSVFTLWFGAGEGLTTAFVLTTIATGSVMAVVQLLLAAFQGKLYAALALDSAWPA